MTNVFRTETYGRIEDEKPVIWTSTGAVVDVDGTAFVRTASGSLLVAFDETWSATAADAKRRAADRLDAAAARISATASALRTEADATTTV